MIIYELFYHWDLISRYNVMILDIRKIFVKNQRQKKEENSIQNNKNQNMCNIEETYEIKIKIKKKVI